MDITFAGEIAILSACCIAGWQISKPVIAVWRSLTLSHATKPKIRSW